MCSDEDPKSRASSVSSTGHSTRSVLAPSFDVVVSGRVLPFPLALKTYQASRPGQCSAVQSRSVQAGLTALGPIPRLISTRLQSSLVSSSFAQPPASSFNPTDLPREQLRIYTSIERSIVAYALSWHMPTRTSLRDSSPSLTHVFNNAVSLLPNPPSHSARHSC